MALLWTTPNVFDTGDNLAAPVFNEVIRDNLLYLFNPQVAVATVMGTGSDVLVTATSPAVIDNSLLGLTLVTTGRRLKLSFTMYVTGNGSLTWRSTFDVLIDGSTYASSMSGVALPNGLYSQFMTNNSYQPMIRFSALLTPDAVAPGTHTFSPVAWLSGGTATGFIVILSAGSYTQFTVGEF